MARRGRLGATVVQGSLPSAFVGQVGDKAAVVPTISGRSLRFGFNTLVPDSEVPLPNGYMLGDIRT